MPSNTLQRTVRRVGAVLVVLLAFTVLYLDRLVGDWDTPVVPDFIAILLPWAVVVVALGYLTVSLLAGVARWLEPGDRSRNRSDVGDSADRGEPTE